MHPILGPEQPEGPNSLLHSSKESLESWSTPSSKAATRLRLQPPATLISLSFSESPSSSAPGDLASSSLQFLISSSHHLELCTSAVMGDWIHDKQ